MQVPEYLERFKIIRLDDDWHIFVCLGFPCNVVLLHDGVKSTRNINAKFKVLVLKLDIEVESHEVNFTVVGVPISYLFDDIID